MGLDALLPAFTLSYSITSVLFAAMTHLSHVLNLLVHYQFKI